MKLPWIAAVMALLVSVVLVPTVNGPDIGASTTQTVGAGPSGTFQLNGAGLGCRSYIDVDVDLVSGGAWVLREDGYVDARGFGEAAVTPVPELSMPFYRSATEGECAVELVPTSGGYWLVTSKGRVLTAGSAVSHGDLSELILNDPIVAAAPTPSGGGYYMLGADGGVFAFGDAQFYGSVQGIVDEAIGLGELAANHLHAPIVTMATTSAGYWLIAGDGAVFPFGDAPYYGSIQDVLNTENQLAGIKRDWVLKAPVTEGVPLAKDALDSPVIDVVPSRAETGYMMLASDGGIFNFGQTQFHGSAAGTEARAAVASDATPSGDGYVILMTREGSGSLLPRFGSLRASAVSVSIGVPKAAANSVPLDIFTNLARQRQLVINELTDKINSGAYGVGEDGVLRGPAGFEIDIGACPETWSNTYGITETEIKIGHVIPSAYGHAPGWASYFNWVNENDPILIDGSPRNTVLLTQDDDGVPVVTTEVVNQLIHDEEVFAVTTYGFTPTEAAYGAVNDRCVPHPFAVTADPDPYPFALTADTDPWEQLYATAPHPALGDPVSYPWSTSALLPDATQTILWGRWLAEDLAEELPVKVAVLREDGDFYQSYEDSFKSWAAVNPNIVSEIATFRHEEHLFLLRDGEQIREMVASAELAEPDVIILATSEWACLSAVAAIADSEALQNVMAKFLSPSCMQQRWFIFPDEVDGWLVVQDGLKDVDDDKHADDPYVRWLSDTLGAADQSADLDEFALGHYYALPYIEALRVAAALPGSLSRTNFMLAMRSLEFDHPLHLDSISFSMNGNADPYSLEGGVYLQFDGETEKWQRVGAAVDLNGQTPNCTWDRETRRCQWR